MAVTSTLLEMSLNEGGDILVLWENMDRNGRHTDLFTSSTTFS